MKQPLAIVTGNQMKFRELSLALQDHFECEQKIMENYHEIQGSPKEILEHKLIAAYEIYKIPVLVDDVSFHFDMLNGFPGPYARDFFAVVSPYEVGKRFVGEKVQIDCRLGLCFSPEKIIIGEGIVSGSIVPAQESEKNLGHFDICVQLDSVGKRMHDLSVEEKNRVSHRGVALQDLLNKLI